MATQAQKEQNMAAALARTNAASAGWGLAPTTMEQAKIAQAEAAKTYKNPVEVSGSSSLKLPPASNVMESRLGDLNMAVNTYYNPTNSSIQEYSNDPQIQTLQQKQSILSDIQRKQQELSGKGGYQADLEADDDYRAMIDDEANLANQLKGEQRAMELELRRLAENPEGKLGSNLNAQMQAVRGKSLQRQADIAITLDVAGGRVDRAYDTILKKVDAKYADVEDAIDYNMQMLKLADENIGILSDIEKRTLKLQTEQEQAQLEQDKLADVYTILQENNLIETEDGGVTVNNTTNTTVENQISADDFIKTATDKMTDAQIKRMKAKADAADVSSMFKYKTVDIRNYLKTIKDKIQAALDQGYTQEEIIAYLAE